MTHTVIIESAASQDLQATYEWLEEMTTSEAAAFWYFETYSAIESLQSMPARCGLAREDQFFKEEIRQLLCGKYRILFEIDGKFVRVLHVRHTARQTLKPKRKSAK